MVYCFTFAIDALRKNKLLRADGPHPSKNKTLCITFLQRLPDVFDFGPTLYKCNTDNLCLLVYTVKPVHTGMPWKQTFIPVWTGSGLERVFAFGEEQTTIT